MDEQRNTTKTNNNNNSFECKRGFKSQREIMMEFADGDIWKCNGCSKFCYQNGICSCGFIN